MPKPKPAKLTKVARTALNLSIAHWRRMTTGKPLAGEKPVCEQCDLCFAFFHQGCVKCPVMLRTGLDACEGTPYAVAASSWRDGNSFKSPAFRAAAKKELRFLESLRFEKGGS